MNLLERAKHALNELVYADSMLKRVERSNTRRPSSIKEFEKQHSEKIQRRRVALIERTHNLRRKIKKMRDIVRNYSRRVALQRLYNARLKAKAVSRVAQMQEKTRLLKNSARRVLLSVHASKAGKQIKKAA